MYKKTDMYIYIHILYIYVYKYANNRRYVNVQIHKKSNCELNQIIYETHIQRTLADVIYERSMNCFRLLQSIRWMSNLNPFHLPNAEPSSWKSQQAKEDACQASFHTSLVTCQSQGLKIQMPWEMPQWVGPQWICSRRPCRLSMPSIIKECLASPPAPWVQGSNVGFVKCPQKIYKNHMADLYLLQGLLFFAQYCSISSQPRWT